MIRAWRAIGGRWQDRNRKGASVLSPYSSSGDAGEHGVPGEPPDSSPDFHSEMAAIRAYYAGKIAAARGSLTPADIAAAVKALLNEEMVASRALSERRRAARER